MTNSTARTPANTTLVVGASGATGRLLVQQLLEDGEQVRAIVRSAASLAELDAQHPTLTVIQGECAGAR